MPNSVQAIAALLNAGKLPDVRAIGGRLKVFTFPMVWAAQAVADTLELGDLPPGFTPLFGIANTDATITGATLNLGTAASAAKYRAAAIITANTPAIFAVYAAKLAVKERLFATVAGAALPGAGNGMFAMIGTVGD